jgi:predicted transcriptional regulator/transcriptional regulator with XRE-family HTH domain
MAAEARWTGDRSAPKIGAKIRRLRRDKSLSQAALAERLGISASYLNLIEHNRRRVTVNLLLQLADMFEIAPADLAEDEEGQLSADVMEVLSRDLFEDLDLTNTDVQELVTASPNGAKALLKLYDAYHAALNNMRSLSAEIADVGPPEVASALPPADSVSDILQANSNYFQVLEDAAAGVAGDITGAGQESPDRDALIRYLLEAQGVRVAFVAAEGAAGFLRRFDEDRRLLEISERVSPDSRKFQLAYQIGLLSSRDVIETLLTENRVRDEQTRALGRVALANYFAAALIMPYQGFLESVKSTRYDIELLQHRYGASFEQICHRMTTLNKPDAKGVPLHMLRVDIAGNNSKRFSLSGLPIPRHGGACVRWNVYSAFLDPGVIHAKVSQLPDGEAYFCIARTVRKGGSGFGMQNRFLSLGLGCELRYAHQFVYSDTVDLERRDRFHEIGVSCRTCERLDCMQRAAPPVNLRYHLDENTRAHSPYVAAFD